MTRHKAHDPPLRRGTCSECGRTDVLLFGRTQHGFTNLGPEAVLLTYHDDPDGLRCPGGGEKSTSQSGHDA